MKRVLLLLLLLPACGPPVIEAEFRPYVQAFEQEAGMPVAANVRFKDLPEGLAGLCEPDLIRNSVWVDIRGWEALDGDEAAQELIIFHELGHCELSRPHLDAKDEDGVPVSIMFRGPMTPLVRPYAEDRQHYIDELFRR